MSIYILKKIFITEYIPFHFRSNANLPKDAVDHTSEDSQFPVLCIVYEGRLEAVRWHLAPNALHHQRTHVARHEIPSPQFRTASAAGNRGAGQ